MTTPQTCNFCDSNGDLQILPLRYAVIGAARDKDSHREAMTWLPKLSGTLGEWVTHIPLGLPELRYVVRPLRCGYLYVLIERNGEKKWEGYAVSKGGELYHFDPEDDIADPEIQDFVCTQGGHSLHASFVHIPDSKNVSRIWLLFTPDLVTKKRLEFLKQYETTDHSTILQVFKPADWKNGDTQQKHSLKPEQIEGTVVETIARTVGPVRIAISHSLYPTYEEIEAKIPLDEESFRKHTDHLWNLQLKLRQLGGLAFVLHDAIGITQELNDYRNAPLEKLKLWQASTHPDRKGDNITNEYRVNVLNAIDDVRTVLRDAAKKNPDVQAEIQHRKRDTFDGCTLYDLNSHGTPVQMAPIGTRGNPRHEAEFKKIEEEINDRWWDEHCEGKGKLKGHLDGSFLRKFRKEYQTLHNWCDTAIRQRYAGHLNWLQSRELLNALLVYDTNAPEGSACGLQFMGQVGLMIAGMDYTEQGSALMDAWARDFNIADNNLLLRAHCYNQTALQTAMTQGMIAAQAAPDMKDEEAFRSFVSRELYGITEDLPDDASAWMDKSRKIAANIAKLADKTVKTMGESANRAWVKKHPLLGKTLTIPQTMFNSALRFNMRPGEEKVAKSLLAMMEAPLGRAAFHSWFGVSFDSKVARLAYLKDPVALYIAKNIVDEARPAFRKTIDIWKGDTTITGDYMRIRTGLIVMGFEAINLFIQGRKAIAEGQPSWQLLAAGLACAGVGGEIYAYGYRTLSRAKPTKELLEIFDDIDEEVIKEMAMHGQQGAGFAYGRIKLWTGTLLGGAGLIGAFLDLSDAAKEKDNNISLMLYIRGYTGILLALTSFGTAWADTGLYFSVLARCATSRIAGRSFEILAKIATALNKIKPLMYRLSVWGTLLILGITLGLYIYEYIFPSILQKWCEKSCFRNTDQKGPYFKGHEEECTALYEAFKVVMKGDEKAGEEEQPKPEPDNANKKPYIQDGCFS
jgi:hypothetical protein